MVRGGVLAGVLVFGLGAVPALACVPPPPLAQLPGESPDAYRDRERAAIDADLFESRHAVQSSLLGQSSATFLGIVTDSRDISVGPVTGHDLTVRPLQAIKGDLPAAPVQIRDKVFTDCGFGGGGSGTSAKPGEYVIVFAGLPPSDLQNATIGILAKEAVLPDLRAAAAIYARDNRR